MASVYKRGNKLWARLKDESGKWACEATPFRPGQEVEARRYLRRLEASGYAKGCFSTETPVRLLQSLLHPSEGREIVGELL